MATLLEVVDVVSDVEKDLHSDVLDDVFNVLRVDGAGEVNIDLVGIADALKTTSMKKWFAKEISENRKNEPLGSEHQ